MNAVVTSVMKIIIIIKIIGILWDSIRGKEDLTTFDNRTLEFIT